MGPYLLAYPVRALALAAPLVIAVGGFAQAACYSSRQQLPNQTLAQFMANPGQLQSRYPTGGAGMISMVRDLVASDPTMLARMLDLSASSNADQINAIGAGLGQAALVCSRGDPAFANEIQQMVAAVNVQPLSSTFTAVVGNSPAPAAVPGARGVRSGADAGNASSSTLSLGVTSPANPATGQPGNPFIAPPGSPVTAGLNPSGTTPAGANVTGGTSPGVTSLPASPGTTGTQSETTALGIPTSTTGSTGVTGSTGTTTTSTTATTTTSVPGSLGTTATGTTGASPAALTTVAGNVTTGVTGGLVTLPIGTTATGAPSGTSSATPLSSSIGTTATSAAGSTSMTSTIGTSVSSATGTTNSPLMTAAATGFVGGSLTLSQTAVAPTGFLTLDFTARGQPVTGGTNGAPRSVSPSQ